MSAIVYNYNEITKEFTFSARYPYDPINKDNLLKPLSSTTIEPPVLQARQAAIFNGKDWEIKRDWRGEESYNIETKEKKVIDYFGEVEEGYTLLVPDQFSIWDNNLKKWIDDIEKIKESKLRELSLYRDKKREVYAFMDLVFFTDENSSKDIAIEFFSNKLEESQDDKEILWKTVGSTESILWSDFKILAIEVDSFVKYCYKVSSIVESEIKQSDDPKKINIQESFDEVFDSLDE